MIALFDADILCYRIGFSTENESEAIALVRMDNYIEEILHSCQASEYEMFLTGKNNFRYKVYPAYKANRRKVVKPKHLQALRQHLIDVEGAVVSEGEEADDLLGINQTYETVICSIDKDLLMIPGKHYNFVRQEHLEVSESEGQYNFYRQMLTGDTVDNIPGIYGLGPKKAADILIGCNTKEDFNKVILDRYTEEFPYCSLAEVINHINIIGRLLWIRRKENEEWQFELD